MRLYDFEGTAYHTALTILYYFCIVISYYLIVEHRELYLELSDFQIAKLRQLTIVTLAEKSTVSNRFHSIYAHHATISAFSSMKFSID